MPAAPSVLLVSPPRAYTGERSFGDTHLVLLGSYLRAHTNANVEIIDLGYEQRLSKPEPERVFVDHHAIVGISCYSSYDYLSAFYLGAEIRRRNPSAILVVGGYHASARPEDFLNLPGSPLEEASPFDHVIVGEGEWPLTRVVEAAGRGERLGELVLGPEPIGDLDDLPAADWALLDRYRPIAQGHRGEVTLYLSRGCPFACTFCMERSKGQSRWRAWSPARAEKELLALHAWLDLTDWKLFIADALFGFDPAWRHEMLERIARLDLPLVKIWALSRADLLDEGDVERYHRAGFGLGLGLETGDPELLALTAKARDPHAFYERFRVLAREAAGVGLPWGANLIAGHPGETGASLERSASFVGELFLETPDLTGFLSVDPFRFHPGSTIDRRLPWYGEQYGTRVHRPRWWNYSEQAFCSEWVDPSSRLDYRQRESLTARLFAPIVDGIAQRFAYRGAARDYFQRSVVHAQENLKPAARLRTIHDYHVWSRMTGHSRSTVVADPEAQTLFRRGREEAAAAIQGSHSIETDARILQAVVAEPREKYVPEDRILRSWQDVSIPLTDDGGATASALHAYLINFTLLELKEGDRLLDVGGGTGYGAALAARLVGPTGQVVSIEIREALADLARENLADRPNVAVVCGDALSPAMPGSFNKFVFGFAVAAVPRAYLDALPEGGRLLAPIARSGAEEGQVLTMYARVDGHIRATHHGQVRYVEAYEPR